MRGLQEGWRIFYGEKNIQLFDPKQPETTINHAMHIKVCYYHQKDTFTFSPDKSGLLPQYDSFERHANDKRVSENFQNHRELSSNTILFIYVHPHLPNNAYITIRKM